MDKKIKFELPPEFDETDFIRKLSDVYSIRPGPVSSKTEVYYDTFDWRLFNESLTLIQRQKEIFLDSLNGTAVLEKTEINALPVFWEDLPEGPLRKRLKPLLEMRALLKLFKRSERVKTFRVLDNYQKTVARLLFSSASFSGTDGRQAQARHLYLEPLRGYPGNFKEVSDFLLAQGFRISEKDIFGDAAEMLDRSPGQYSTKIKVPLDPEMPAIEAAKAILCFILNIISENEAGIRKDIDTEFLHDFRVAIRRTRSALGQIKNIFPPDITGRFREEFSCLGKLSNHLRDWDVYLLHEERYKEMLPENLREAIAPLFTYIKAERKKEFRKVIRGLNSPQYSAVLRDWQAFLQSVPEDASSAPGAFRPVVEVARERIYKKYQKILRLGGKIKNDSPDKKLHRLRIECKRLRYLMEFFCEVFPGEEINILIKQLKKLQDNLGRYQDFSVQKATLGHFAQKFSASNADRERKTILAIGALIGTLEMERRKVRKSFANTFTSFASAENKKMFAKLAGYSFR